jgi:hypothetical protein
LQFCNTLYVVGFPQLLGYFRGMAKIGRPCILGDRPMTPAERQQRSRWLRTLFDQMFGRRRDRFEEQQRWLRRGEPKFVAWQLAGVHFDYKTKTANFARWNEINEHVLDRLVALEQEFSDCKVPRSKS